MILIGIGSNLAGAGHLTPRAVCEAALRAVEAEGIIVAACSRWYATAPVPASDQPWFVNGVASLHTRLEPAALLEAMHRIEAAFGRVRTVRNAARILDLDLLCHGARISDASPILPHPRLHQRAFVLLPMAELAPDWRHPVDGRPIAELIADLPSDQTATILP